MHHSVQIEGRGNGIKTNVVNNVDIAKALERPPECEYQHQQQWHLGGVDGHLAGLLACHALLGLEAAPGWASGLMTGFLGASAACMRSAQRVVVQHAWQQLWLAGAVARHAHTVSIHSVVDTTQAACCHDLAASSNACILAQW